ncbi:hypothetical protein AB0L47_24280 [Streptomyces bobili]|uniref:hypothetical protein n=1 Tax=Streptomyces bobili TaxID=67280 RepID=UPI00342DD505
MLSSSFNNCFSPSAVKVAEETVLENATRSIEKGTLVPLEFGGGGAYPVYPFVMGFLHQMDLKATDLERIRTVPGVSESIVEALTPFVNGERDGNKIESLTTLRAEDLRSFGEALVEMRGQAAQTPEDRRHLEAARAALATFRVNTAAPPVGMLNLERLEMTPAGIERGELIATIPLAPHEETAVTEKEWSVQSKEFTSIVTDELEQYSETGVTDNTELAQSTSSQQQHANQFNITGTVTGGIPIIHGSVTTTYTGQGSDSVSATESRKQAKSLTQKASTRSKREHKVTINTKSVVGHEETVARKLVNMSNDPIRIDYFSLMRKWRVRLYRYGLRLTYDITLPEPGATLRQKYYELAALKSRLGPFEFTVRRSDITTDIVDTSGNPAAEGIAKYQWLADKYGASVKPYPDTPSAVTSELHGAGNKSWMYLDLNFTVPPGAEIEEVQATVNVGKHPDEAPIVLELLGSTLRVVSDAPAISFADKTALTLDGSKFMAGQSGQLKATYFLHRSSAPFVRIKAVTRNTSQTIEQWRDDVWTALFDAAQRKYYAEQQEIAASITEIEEGMSAVNTLTLRREENDEIMRAVLRFIAGPNYQYMSDAAISAFERGTTNSQDGSKRPPGVSFIDNKSGLDDDQFATVQKHENIARFINQAIEWENVVSFLYSYFWDTPRSWEFIRQIQHSDPTRQAFLRAGAARVVLTVRKGWEERWLRFAESGFTDVNYNTPNSAYLTVAQEINAYDNRNYPGIPPANPGSHRPADSVVTTSKASVAASNSPVTIDVDSTDGFVVGQHVVIGSAGGLPNTQETQVINKINGPKQLIVGRLSNAHDGSQVPFPVIYPGEKGAIIAEWNEYTPSSGTDIQRTSNLDQIF